MVSEPFQEERETVQRVRKKKARTAGVSPGKSMSVIVGCRATLLWPNDRNTSTNSLLRRCKPPKASVMNTGC